MKKLIFVLISVLLFASCSQIQNAYENISASPGAAETGTAHTSPAPPSVLPAPSPSQGFISCKEGERVSEYFYTGDLERFFVMQPKELISLLGGNYEEPGYDPHYYEYVITCETHGISLHYTPDFENDTLIPGLPLARVVLSDFDFKGLNASSSFDDITSTLGKTDLLILHVDGGFFYALCYTIDGLQYEFSAPDEKGAGGLTLTLASASYPQFFYQSCKKGESVSKTLTTSDIKTFLKLSPEKLRNMLGEANSEFGDEDTGIYGFHYRYLGVSFEYTLGFEEDDITYLASLPLNCIGVDDFEFRGLNKDSTYEDIIHTLKGVKMIKGFVIDDEYYYLQAKVDGMLFIFTGWDEEDGDGVSLGIKPAIS